MWSITALDLDHWSGNPVARTVLPALVRRLVHASASPRQIDFPAYDGVDAPGWDGTLKLDTSTSPWTPAGSSFWEMSCRADVARKAASDFKKRTEATSEDLRRNAIFVFVTARRWPGKEQWIEDAKAGGAWADVLAYDAQTLSQWLETAPAAAAWMHSHLGRGVDDLCAPDDLWDIWAGATQPRLTFDIFAEAYEESRCALQAFFAAPPGRALPVAADTRGEAAAFAAGALMFGGDFTARNCVVARTEAGLHRLRRESAPPIVLVADRRLEAALGDLPQKTWVLIATDRASLDQDARVEVRPLTWEAYHRTVRALDLDGEAAAALDKASSRRVTIIRRRLSSIPQVRRPLWADMPDLTPTLAGLAMAGGWLWEKEGDRQALAAITDRTESEVELAIQRLVTLEDAPVFAVAGAGGLISRHDAFPPLRHALTRGLVERFYRICREVFGAADPSLELPSEQRWAANFYGKERPHSGRLRGQFATSLAFLSAATTSYVEGCDVRQASEVLVKDLLADDAAWLRLRDVLPQLAEAAPRAFLGAAMRCLPFEAEDRGLWALVKPTDGNGYGESLRVQLIWALERLGADPAHFSRVTEILAALCSRQLDDNLVTKPHASLVAMLHPRRAEDTTTARLQGRVLKVLGTRKPEVAWTVALALVDERLGGGLVLQNTVQIGTAGHGPMDGPVDAREAAFDIALGRDLNTQEALGLIEKSPCFDGPLLTRLWDRISEWQETAPEPDRAKAREAVRRSALWRERRRGKGWQIGEDARAREIFNLLQAPGPAGQYAWLFQASHVQHGSDELWDEKLDWQERQARIDANRRTAVETLWTDGGLPALVEFAKGVGSPETVGGVASRSIAELDVVAVAGLAEQADDWPGRHAFIAGVFMGPREERDGRLQVLQAAWTDRPDALLDILLLCPSDAVTWRQVERLSPSLQTAYWRRLTRRTWSDVPEEIARATREFLRAERPCAALNQTLGDLAALDTPLLVEVLLAVAKIAGPEDDGLVDPHAIQEILSALDQRPDIDRNQRLQLDFIYVDALEHSERGLAALSEELAANPEVFALAIRSYYQRDDGSEEPLDEGGEEASRQAATHWIQVLATCRCPPGGGLDRVIDPVKLQTWLLGVADLLAADGRMDRGLYKVGVLMGRLRLEVDGVWPSFEIAAVLEPYANESFCSGIEIGILNSRGIHSRGRMAGGTPERVLAEKYRSWRRRLEVECPNLAQAFEAVASTYDRHAQRHDEESEFERVAVR